MKSERAKVIAKVIEKSDREHNLTKRHEVVTDPFIDEIRLSMYRKKEFVNGKLVFVPEPIITEYSVIRKPNVNSERNVICKINDTDNFIFTAEVKPSRRYGVGSRGIYDVAHCLLDFWRKEGRPDWFTIKSLKKIKEATGHTNEVNLEKNILAFCHYDIRVDYAWDREEGISLETESLAPFRAAQIFKPRYRQGGIELTFHVNPYYVEYFEKNIVYLDFELEDLYRRIPPKYDMSRRAMFIISKLYNIGRQKHREVLTINAKEGLMFSEAFQLPHTPAKRKKAIDYIMNPIKDAKFIAKHEYDPKKGEVVVTMPKKPLSKSQKAEAKELLPAPEEQHPPRVVKAIELLKSINFTNSQITEYAQKYTDRILTMEMYLKDHPNLTGAWVRKILDSAIIGDWDIDFVEGIGAGTYGEVEKDFIRMKGTNEKISREDIIEKLRKYITKKQYIIDGFSDKSHRKFIEYFFGNDIIEHLFPPPPPVKREELRAKAVKLKC